MITTVYMVRHSESIKTDPDERMRGLTEKGVADARQVTRLLMDEGIEVFISSPYKRAVLTIEEAARCAGKEIETFEELKELAFAPEIKGLPDPALFPHLAKMFGDPDFALPCGETAAECRNRAVATLKQILNKHRGRKIAIGTHGAVMTLMMGYFDERYGLDFLRQTSKPDIYIMKFHGEEFIRADRILLSLAESETGGGSPV
ncbi:histidine phosphatase family protein [Paenibacillus sp. M1]|uniref:Histidine phosphatase family protein n=1 Tax=Paenibacillus haidiansis TaxID=1574488 RepID=A0ABU7VNJ9_9BACL